MTDITQRLREAAADICTERLCEEAADTIDRLRTVMVAAAEEIHQHWQAHCDEEGYGPQNLMHRLENGIASQYGYTAGAFAEQKAEIDRLRAALRGMLVGCEWKELSGCWAWHNKQMPSDAALATARAALGEKL